MPADTYGKTNLQPGFRLLDGSVLNELLTRVLQGGLSREDGITATPGGTKAAARVLTKTLNGISVCATAADSVLLPKAIAGSILFLTNYGAESAQVFGKGTDTINGVATATGVAQATGLSACYFCLTTGAWYRILSA
jgi:hypothetical protein